MHHFIYSAKDTYVTNESTYLQSNFGIDEMVEVKANTQLYRNVTIYQTGSVSQSYSSPTRLYLFTGQVYGYLSGSAYGTSSLINDANGDLSGAFYTFNGRITGSINGTPTTSSVINQAGHLSGSLSGSITGSWNGILCDASGSLNTFSGLAQGIVIGSQSVYSPATSFENVSSLSRALLQFDITAISQSIANGSILNTGSLSFKLKLAISEVNEVPLTYSIYAYPISQSWLMGNGRYETGGTSTGASWYYRDFAGTSGSLWYTPIDSSSVYPVVDYFNTASYATQSFTKGGGTWYYSIPSSYQTASSGYCAGLSASNSLIAKQAFNYEASDISMDVTNIVKSWICGCVPNEGIILLTSLETSQIPNNTGVFKFFSKDTNTIYTPYIDAQWDDSVYTTGSLNPVSETVPFTVVIRNLNRNYKFGSMPRVDVFARTKNPLKNFVPGPQINQYVTSSLLPTSSYYAIKDNENERMILDFDSNTKLSCDGNLHYFILDTTSFAHERYYRLLIKVVTNNETQIFDNGYVFKITR